LALPSPRAILEGTSEIEQNEGEARSYHRWQFRLGALSILLTAGYLVTLLPRGVVTLAAFWVADRALAAVAGALGLSGPADIAGLPLLGLVTIAVSLIALPVTNAWFRRLETRTDDFALSLTRAPGPFIGAMERLAGLNLAERDPHLLKELPLYSHPSVGRRIARARNRTWSED
jgi:Zn-dependent protease with chaperone function